MPFSIKTKKCLEYPAEDVTIDIFTSSAHFTYSKFYWKAALAIGKLAAEF